MDAGNGARLKGVYMFTVEVYEDDRVTFAGIIRFHELGDAVHYAKLNMPCRIWFGGELLNSFGFEEEE